MEQPSGVIVRLEALPARRGHFLLESGYHADLWLTLDAIFVDPTETARLAAALAAKLHPYAPSAVCGPLLGGAFLALALAGLLEARFYYTEPDPAPVAAGLFNTQYRLPPELSRRVRGERVAVVDDAISAGSSVRATIEALTAAGATPVVVGSILSLGNEGLTHFAARGIPVETLNRRGFTMWKPADCPLCRGGTPLEDFRCPA